MVTSLAYSGELGEVFAHAIVEGELALLFEEDERRGGPHRRRTTSQMKSYRNTGIHHCHTCIFASLALKLSGPNNTRRVEVSLDIKGWDIICALTVAEANAQLAAQSGRLLESFDYAGENPFAGTFHISGRFGTWSIVSGSNTLVNVDIPILTGTIALASGKQTDISGMTVTVEIPLTLVTANDGQYQELRFDFTAGAGTNPDVNGRAIAGIRFTPPGAAAGTTVMMAVAECLAANGSEISFVFAQIGGTSAGSSPWLMPVQSAYDYQSLGDGNDYLAILSVTDNRPIEGLDTQIDPSLLVPGFAITIGIAGPLIMQNVVLPGLTAALGVPAGTFHYDSASGSIASSASFDAPSVNVALVDYTPVIDSMVIALAENQMTTATQGHCNLPINATMTFSVSGTNAAVYDPSTETLAFQADAAPNVTHDDSVPWYDYASPALVIAIPIIASHLATYVGSVGVGAPLTVAPPQSIRWTGLGGWTVASAGLDDLLYMRGNFAET